MTKETVTFERNAAAQRHNVRRRAVVVEEEEQDREDDAHGDDRPVLPAEECLGSDADRIGDLLHLGVVALPAEDAPREVDRERNGEERDREDDSDNGVDRRLGHRFLSCDRARFGVFPAHPSPRARSAREISRPAGKRTLLTLGVQCLQAKVKSSPHRYRASSRSP